MTRAGVVAKAQAQPPKNPNAMNVGAANSDETSSNTGQGYISVPLWSYIVAPSSIRRPPSTRLFRGRMHYSVHSRIFLGPAKFVGLLWPL